MAEMILGKKVGMTQIFMEDGTVIPVTVIQAGPCPVVQIKSTNVDGYEAVQIGFDRVPVKRLTKAQIRHLDKAKTSYVRILREFKTDTTGGYKVGDELTVSRFIPGEKVDIVGVTKGRGFAGVMVRHNMAGAPGGHGTHEFFRHGGSIGCHTWPGRVWKGKRMAGHLGATRVTVKNLTVVRTDLERNLLVVKGAVPGANAGYLMIRKTRSKRS